jgi:uncharacterized protein (DUF2252 family)
MLHNHFDLATELFADRLRVAEQERLAHEVSQARGRSTAARLRRAGALAATSVARRLDECAARAAFERLSVDHGR